MTVEAVDALVAIMRDPNAPAAVQLQAATAILDRAWGKPKAQIEKPAVENKFDRMSEVELREHLARQLREIKDLEARLNMVSSPAGACLGGKMPVSGVRLTGSAPTKSQRREQRDRQAEEGLGRHCARKR